MAAIGERIVLSVLRDSPPGLILDGENLGEVLLPRREVPPGTAVGHLLEVIVRRDFTGRMVASSQVPKACLGEFAFLRVKNIHPRIGAYLEWCAEEDLLLPAAEVSRHLTAGNVVLVCVVRDLRNERLVATIRLDRHMSEEPPPFVTGQRVHLLIAAESPLGYKAIIENSHWGLLYKSIVGSPVAIGDEVDGFVRGVRPDGKVDLALDPSGYGRVAPLCDRVLEAAKAAGGRLQISDQSTPAEIRDRFGCSKKAFKQALGALYRSRRLKLDGDWVEVQEPPPQGPVIVQHRRAENRGRPLPPRR